jgi:ATP-dependent RNA helicase RhlE
MRKLRRHDTKISLKRGLKTNNVFKRSNRTALFGFGKVVNVLAGTSRSGFDDLGISPALLEAIRNLNFSEPTPVQKQAIPVAILGRDIIGIAQTGTGKTIAFGIPMIQRLAQARNGRGLIVVPTRELAHQVDDALRAICRAHQMRTAVIIGGASMEPQRRALAKNPHIIIATPGRLLDHFKQGTISLARVEILVLDEADRMLDMGFAPDINRIIAALPRKRQTMLFSATMPREILAIARKHMIDPEYIEVAPSGAAPEEISHELFYVDNRDKTRLLEILLSERTGSTLIFTRTRHSAGKLTRRIKSMGFSVAEIHSDRSLRQRFSALDGFKAGEYRVLVATDIAARGIDVTDIALVINYDLPSTSEDYVHRIGRTGRAGRDGHAISFATFDQENEVRAIENLMNVTLQVSDLPFAPSRDIGDHEQGRRPSGPTRPLMRSEETPTQIAASTTKRISEPTFGRRRVNLKGRSRRRR